MTTDTANGDNNKGMEKYFFRASAQDFMGIPGNPIAYWVSSNEIQSFLKFKNMGDYSTSSNGVQTGNNNKYLRLWHEVVSSDRKKWFPYNKGGPYRKWYGNYNYLVNWQNNGSEIKTEKNHCARGEDFYFKSGITWSDVTSGKLSGRILPEGFLFDASGPSAFFEDKNTKLAALSALNTFHVGEWSKMLNPTLHFQSGDFRKIPLSNFLINNTTIEIVTELVCYSKTDWDSYETSWDFTSLPLLQSNYRQTTLAATYETLRAQWQENTLEMQRLEKENNRIFIEAYGLEDELTPDVPLNEITLTCNPHYRYRLGKQLDDASEVERNAELERQLQSDTICELISYIIGCMMGRYSIDQPGLILASQGERLQDYLQRVPNPRFMPDDDAIVPLTDQEWFEDDATHRVREFVRTVWGEQHLQENLDFIAESLCLSAMRPRKGESSLDCIRRYLSTQFYKDHMRTYKKRPIYWLFSSGRLKAFECLVYLHRYNEGTLARMRTEYVIPLTAKLHSYTERLENEKANSTSTADTRRLEKEIDQLHKQQAELAAFDEQLRDFADQRIQLDLDDGVKVNYGKFGNLLADVKAIVG